MTSIASLESDVVGDLLELLQKEAIPFKVQTTTQEGGLDISEILVEDADYDRACDVAEKWEADRVDKVEKQSGHYCLKCGSRHLTYAPLDNGVLSYRCQECGHEFLAPVKWRT